ncbi:MAG TPA: HAD family phosphatase [Acidimicrobiales bacterium]|nr:HAD family phosphatase [Acidimicrobiales bacterium]
MPAESPPVIHSVVFDVGGVLIDWDPRHLYRKLFADEDTMEHFLSEVCTPAWHAQHDLGASYGDTIPALVAAHPQWATEIRAWSERFSEMYGGPIEGTVHLLRSLQRGGVPVVASTNWGAASWADARAAYPFLELFDGALVSGEVGIAKPDPAFYELLVETFGLDPRHTLYIEDTLANVLAAAERGFVTHAFTSPDGLALELRRLGLIP